MSRPLAAAVVMLALLSGCKSAQVHSMARTTRIADMRFGDEYTAASNKAIAEAPEGKEGWDFYDAAMEMWYLAYAAMRNLIGATLSLDVSKSRHEFRAAGCRWYRSLEAVDETTPVELPAVKAGLDSRWRRRCN